MCGVKRDKPIKKGTHFKTHRGINRPEHNILVIFCFDLINWADIQKELVIMTRGKKKFWEIIEMANLSKKFIMRKYGKVLDSKISGKKRKCVTD